MTVPTNLLKVLAVDSSRTPWSVSVTPQTGARVPTKTLLDDPATGMQVFLMRYDAGFTNIWHTHPHAHGMYVLDGVLTTHDGEYGPGTFVWFPEGGWMQHGATATNDCTFLFITDKPFAICYQTDPDHPYPEHTAD